MNFSKKQIISFSFISIFIISLTVVLYSVRSVQDTRSRADEGPTFQTTPTTSLQNDLCDNVKSSLRVISPNEFVTIIAKSKKANIRKFLYTFLNLDNIDTNSSNPQNISFIPQKDFKISHTSSGSGLKWDLIHVKFADMDKPDLNWEGKKPKHIRVDVYFTDEQGNRSETNPKCQVQFDVGSE